MESTTSVSKGCFIYKGAMLENLHKNYPKQSKQHSTSTNTTILTKDIIKQPFYKAYQNTWQLIKSKIEQVQNKFNAEILHDIVEFANRHSRCQDLVYLLNEEILSCAVVLTGINQSDHLELFDKLTYELKQNVSCSICMLYSNDCSTPKTALENMIYNFMEQTTQNQKLKRPQCTMWRLKQWYNNHWNNNYLNQEITEETFLFGKEHPSHLLIVILPDFECCPPNVLHDLIAILTCYCQELPLILILGVVTMLNTIQDTLPYQVLRKLRLNIFQTQSAPIILNKILDDVVLSPEWGFHVSGNTLQFLTHIFLHYDFSLKEFIKNLKYCIMMHYKQSNAYSLCCSYKTSLEKISFLTHNDLEDIRKQLSFRPFVENLNDYERIIKILTDDKQLQKELPLLLKQCHIYFTLRRCFLQFLCSVVFDLPSSPLGKYHHDLYIFIMDKDLIKENELKECWQMIKCMSKENLLKKFQNALKDTQKYFQNKIQSKIDVWQECEIILKEEVTKIQEILNKLENSKISSTINSNKNITTNIKNVTSRQDLKEKLQQLQTTQREQTTNDVTKIVEELLIYIEENIIKNYLKTEKQSPPLYELFTFSQINEIKNNLIGAPRAALHLALNNPYYYLQCKCCCNLYKSTHLLATLPDICIAYKLYLECGRMINLYDWLQAFHSIVEENEDHEKEHEENNSKIQARFARCIAELQFLGYIKMSKRKTDHATRLTW